MKQSDKRWGILWLVLYLLFALAPLILMLVGERPMGREFIRELSVAAGFAGIGLMALHFVLTARITAIKAPYGSDVVYYFHHRMAYFTLFLWLIHPVLLFVKFDWALGLLNVFTAPWRARWGVLSVAAILVLMVISIWRSKLKVEYVAWRMTHGLLAVLAMLAVMIHAYMVGKYIGTPVKQALWLGYGAICVLLVAYLRVYKPWQMLRHPYRVVRVQPERASTWNLTLEPVGHAGMRFHPGQFAWLTAWRSPFSAHEHPFSFSSSSEQTGQVGFAIKELGDFTATIGRLQPGQRVYIDGPYGAFSPDRYADAEHLVLIAGGVGIAPMMSILHSMVDRRDTRPVTLLYGSRDWDSIAFREELAGLERALKLNVVHVLESAPEGWAGETGFVTDQVLARHLPDAAVRYHVFLCGPLGMLNAVEAALARLQVSAARVHLERYDF